MECWNGGPRNNRKGNDPTVPTNDQCVFVSYRIDDIILSVDSSRPNVQIGFNQSINQSINQLKLDNQIA